MRAGPHLEAFDCRMTGITSASSHRLPKRCHLLLSMMKSMCCHALTEQEGSNVLKPG